MSGASATMRRMPTLRLRVELLDVPRPVVRILDIPVETTLHGLHLVLQKAFSWRDEQQHSFTLGPSRWVAEPAGDELPEWGVTAGDLLESAEGELVYTYDFNDEWRHSIRLVGTDRRYRKRATLVRGHGTSPLEDCGGARAWASILRDIDRAAAGELAALENPEAYRATFGEICPLEVQRDFASFDEWEKSFAMPAVKKVDVVAEPKASASKRASGRLSEQPAFLDPAVAEGLLEAADRRGVLHALGEYFGSPLLTAMIHRHEATVCTMLSDVHAKRVGRTLKGLLQILPGTVRSQETEAEAFEMVDEINPGWGNRETLVLLERMFCLVGLGEQGEPGIVFTVDARRALRMTDIEFTHHLAGRFRSLRGERFVTAVLAFLYIAHGDAAAARLAELRSRTRLDEHEQLFDDLGEGYFPRRHAYPLACDLVFDRIYAISEPLTRVVPKEEDPHDPGIYVTNVALAAFARECLAGLEHGNLLPEELVAELS